MKPVFHEIPYVLCLLSTETTVSSGLSACNLVLREIFALHQILDPLPTPTLFRVLVGGWYRVGVGGCYRVGVGGWYRVGVGGW